jgi:hypothetical protein
MADDMTTGMGGADWNRILGADELRADWDRPPPARRRGWARRSTRRLLASREPTSGQAQPSAPTAGEEADSALEQRLMRALKDVAATLDVSPGDLIEGIVRGALEKGSEIGYELGVERGPEPQEG